MIDDGLHNNGDSVMTPHSFTRRRWLARLGGAGLVASLAPHALAAPEPFPSRPIKLVVPFPPGSGTDIAARHFARLIGELSGQPAIVENKPGGNGFIAVQLVLNAPADGYTVRWAAIRRWRPTPRPSASRPTTRWSTWRRSRCWSARR